MKVSFHKVYWLMVIVFLGMTIGICLSPVFFRHSSQPDATELTQTDTVVVHDMIRYSKLELSRNTYKLDLPRTGKRQYIFIPVDSTTIIYRDDVRYVTHPRENYFTETDDARIWHSGLDSRIDSLIVFSRTKTVTNTIKPVTKRHSLALGIEGGYAEAFRMPVQLEYSRRILPWFSVYAFGEYELFTKQIGVGAGMRAELSW